MEVFTNIMFAADEIPLASAEMSSHDAENSIKMPLHFSVAIPVAGELLLYSTSAPPPAEEQVSDPPIYSLTPTCLAREHTRDVQDHMCQLAKNTCTFTTLKMGLALNYPAAADKVMFDIWFEALGNIYGLKKVVWDQEFVIEKLEKSALLYQLELAEVSNHTASFILEILTDALEIYKKYETSMLHTCRAETKEIIEEDFASNFEGEEHPCARWSSLHSNFGWDFGNDNVPAGHHGEGIEKHGVRAAQEGECFSNGIVQVGRGGASGGGWCSVM